MGGWHGRKARLLNALETVIVWNRSRWSILCSWKISQNQLPALPSRSSGICVNTGNRGCYSRNKHSFQLIYFAWLCSAIWVFALRKLGDRSLIVEPTDDGCLVAYFHCSTVRGVTAKPRKKYPIRVEKFGIFLSAASSFRELRSNFPICFNGRNIIFMSECKVARLSFLPKTWAKQCSKKQEKELVCP